MGDGGVSIEAVAEAGDILAEEVDVLLERLTDKVLGSPGADRSREWYPQWEAQHSPNGHRSPGQRLLVKSAIAARASIDPVHDIERVRRTGTTAANDRQPRDRVQLTIW